MVACLEYGSKSIHTLLINVLPELPGMTCHAEGRYCRLETNRWRLMRFCIASVDQARGKQATFVFICHFLLVSL